MLINKKVSILLPDLRGGGVENMRVKLTKDWLAKGIKVEIILLNSDGVLVDNLPSGVKIIDLKSKRIMACIKPLIKYLSSTDSNVLLVAMWPLTVISAFAKLASRSKIKLIVSEHSILSKSFSHKGKFHELLIRVSMMIFYRFCDCRIGVSKGVVKEISRLSLLPESKFKLIYNPAYSEMKCIRSESTRKQNEKVIITAGSFKSVKNHSLLIRAFADLINITEMKCKLIILGDGKLKNEYLELIASLQLNEHISLPGYKADPRPYFMSSDLFVLSSNHEGLGNVIIEALGCGLPIVSTDCESGPREILADGEHGRLVPVNDAPALADAMLDALKSSHDTNALKLRAEDFSIEKISQQYLDVMFPEEVN